VVRAGAQAAEKDRHGDSDRLVAHRGLTPS